MNTTITLSKDVEDLLQESTEPTTIAADSIATPPAPKVEPIAAPVVAAAPAPVEVVEPVSEEYLEMAADIIVNTFDAVQAFGFSFAADKVLRRKAKDIAGDDAMQKLTKLINKKDDTEVENTAEQNMLFELYTKVKEYKEDLDFDDRVVKNMKGALKEILRKKAKKLSPEFLLMLAVMGGLTPNFAALKTL